MSESKLQKFRALQSGSEKAVPNAQKLSAQVKEKQVQSVKQFTEDADNFFYSVSKDVTDGNAFNAAEYFKERQQQADELKQRAAALSLYMDKNADIYTPESYDTLKNILSTFNTQADEAIANLDSYFNQWGSYDAYDDYQAKRTLDLDTARQEISDLEAARNDYAENHEIDWTSASDRKAYEQYLQDLDKQISEKRKQANQAQLVQDNIALSSVTGNNDFADLSGYVSTESKTDLARNFSQYGMGYDDLTYEYINNQNGIRDQINKNQQMYGTYSPQTGELVSFSDRGYDLLTPEETAIYNYHYSTGGREKAQQYLDSIQESLSYRKAEEWAQSVAGNTLREYGFGAKAGVKQFGDNIKSLVNSDGEYTSPSAYQFASGMVREDLADVGAKLPEFLGGASAGQVGYDLINTGANMAPSILASAAAGFINPALGKVVGSALMGMSAAGGAYQEALNEGYAKEQALKYGAESGAAEAGMEYLLGGIGAFSRGSEFVDEAIEGIANPVARFFANLGKNVASEGFEEGLQEYISPQIKNRNLYTEEKAAGSDIAYAALLGGLTGGVMDLPGSVASSFSTSSRSNANYSDASTEVSSEEIPEIKTQVSKDGNARQISSNEPIEVLDFASVDGKNTTIQLKDGGTVDYNDVSFATEADANRFYAVSSLPGIDTENANNLLHTIEEANAGGDIDSVTGIREAYGMGYYGMQESDLAKGIDSSQLAPTLRKAVYDIGRQQRNADAIVKATATEVTAKPAEGYKKVVFEGNVNRTVKKNAAEIRFVDYIADNFSGNTVHIYESFKGRDNKYYYRDSKGELHRAPNGRYVNGEIWLDIKAGDNGEGLMLNTFSHEMYHHIEKYNKTKANELAEFVVKELGFESVEKAVAEQIKKARKAGLGESYFISKGMTKDQAANEVYTRAMSDFVADSLETMFTRGNPAEAIAKLKTENRTLFDEIKAFIDKWVSKLKKYYSDKTISKEGEMVAQLDRFEELQKLFMEAMQGSGENYRAALSELTPSEAGEIVNDNGELAAASTKNQGVQADRDLKETKNSERRYSYETITSKPDMAVTLVGDNVPNNRSDVVAQAKKNAAFVGKFNPKDGSVSVHVRDIGKDVVLGTAGLKHGLDRRMDSNAAVTLMAGEILQNSIQINEMTPQKAEADGSYILIGAARNIDGELYIVRSVINSFSNELASMDVLYAINAKKGNRLRSMRPGFQGPVTDSTISIADLLEYVNEYFPDILPEDVLKHFGHEARPDGKLGESALYSLRNEDNSPRTILSRIDPNSRKLKSEQQHLGFYQERLKNLGVAEQRLNEVNAKIRSLPENSKREIQKLQMEARNIQHNIDNFNRDLKRAERSEMFKRIVAEERKKLSDTTLRKYKEEQRQNIKSMQAENRAIREELTGTQSVMSIMEDEFVRLAKDLEAKKIDLKTMQEMFLNQSKQYDKDTQKWLREYRNLMSQYQKLDARNDRNLSKIEQLEQIILRQRQTAKAKVTSRRNTEMRHKIQRKADELNRVLLHGTKHRNVPEYLQPVVADILNAINMEVRDGEQRRASYEATLARYDRQIAMTTNPDEVTRLIEKRNEYAAKGDQFANKMAELKDAYQKIQDDKIPNMEIDEGLSARLMELFVIVGDTPLGQMTSEQLDAVNDVLSITQKTISNANKLFQEGQRKGVEEASKSTMREVRSVGGGAHKTTDFLDSVSKFGWNNLKPVYAFEAIGSPTLTNLFKNLRKGEDTLAVDLNEAKNFFQAQWKKYHGNDWDMEKKWKFTSSADKPFELDINQIMSLYALSKRDQARDHLRVGGFSFDSQYKRRDEIKVGPFKIKGDVKTTDASAYNLTDETLGEIIGKLTPDQRAFVDAMQAYLSDTMAAKGNEISLQKYGIRLFKEQNYFPLRVADQYMARVREQQTGDRKLKNSGFTKSVTPHAKNPVILSSFTEVWAEHVDEMSLYHSFVLPLDDMNRVLNYHDMFREEAVAGSVVEAIRNAYGEGATQYIDQLLRDVNGGARTDSVANTINKWMGKAKKAQTMASLSVAIQQPSSILRAAAMIDGKYFAGPKVTEKTHDRTWDEIKKWAPVAIIKEMGGFDVNVGKSTVDYLTDTAEYNGFGEKFKAMFTDEQFRDDALGRLPALMDEMAWGVIWNAVKREQAELHPDIKGEAFMKMVSDRFTDVIVHTQVYDSVFSRSGMMRSKDTGAKMMTSFMAEPTTTINMLQNAIMQANRRMITKGQAAKTVGAIVASLALNSALVSIAYAARDDDEEKRFDEKWIENFYENFFNSLNPLGYIPFLRDVQNAFRGYDTERADVALFGDLMNAVDGLGSEDLSAWEKVESILGSVGNIFGVPLKNILRDGRGIAKTIAIALDKESRDPATKTGRQMARKAGLQSAAKGINPFANVDTYNNGEEMLLAIQRGDEAHIQRVFGRFENQQKAESALQSAIREKYLEGDLSAEETEDLLTANFDREDADEVYWILEKWNYAKENGSEDGYAKYNNLYQMIDSGEDYASEITRLMEHGADASTIRSQISKKYRKEYLADETVREEIRETLLPVYEATGMDESDIMDKFNDWDFEAAYGMTYSEFKAEYKAGNATEAEMRQAMKTYGLLNYEIEENIRSLNKEKKFEEKYGMSLSEMRDAYDNGDISKNQLINALVFNGATKTEAQDEVGQRDVTNKYGIDYMKLDDAYKYGDISRQTFYQSLIDNGTPRAEADEAILGYDWLKKNVKKYPDLQISDARRFVLKVSDKMEERTLTDYGVSVDSYLEYKEKAKDCKGVDTDGDGYADPYTKAKQLFAMIDALPISNEAKDGLALVSNAMSTIKKYAPWR